jgi:polyhydroxyalkanoate synthesis regulator phasin
MREAYEQRATDLENKCNRKLTSLRDELELHRKTVVLEVEEVIFIQPYS